MKATVLTLALFLATSIALSQNGKSLTLKENGLEKKELTKVLTFDVEGLTQQERVELVAHLHNQKFTVNAFSKVTSNGTILKLEVKKKTRRGEVVQMFDSFEPLESLNIQGVVHDLK